MEEIKENLSSEKTATAGTHRKTLKQRFSPKRLAVMGIFVALSYVVSLLEIPMPLFGAIFLQLDFSNVFIVLISFLLGPVEGVLVCFLKESLRCLSSGTFCAGEVANFIITSVYLLLPSIAYSYKRTLKTVLITLSVSCVIATGFALLANRFIIFPVYAYLMGGVIRLNGAVWTVSEAFSALWLGVLLFNVIKSVAVGIATLLLYKRLSNFFKKLKI